MADSDTQTRSPCENELEAEQHLLLNLADVENINARNPFTETDQKMPSKSAN